MKRLIAKMRKLKITRWEKLTLGEKIIKIIMSLIKIAIVAAIVVTVIGCLGAIIFGAVIALGIGNAIAGGFRNAGRAYVPGDINIRRW